MATGKLISFEGIECSGKDTQIALLAKYLRQHNIDFSLEHEPGGTLYGEALRAILKHPELVLPAIYKAISGHSDFKHARLSDNPDYDRTPECELFLFAAARAEFSNKIIDLILDGTNVIVNRFSDSTTAYQGGGHRLSTSAIITINNMATDNLWPKLTLLIDIPVKTMLERMAKQSKEKNAFFEQRYDRNFFERVRNEYLEIARLNPERVKVIDGTKSIKEVFEQIRHYVDELFGLSYVN
jgi:dTMP kinase